MNKAQKIEAARERIKELLLLIEYWEKNNK